MTRHRPMARAILVKNNREIFLLNIEAYYIFTEIKTLWCWQKSTHVDQKSMMFIIISILSNANQNHNLMTIHPLG